jgi:hypothetical protein
MARYEWFLVEILVLGIAVYEWVKIRRAVKRDRLAREQAKVDTPQAR